MVFKIVQFFMIGVGAASVPIHFMLHMQLKKEQRELAELFKKQREHIFLQRMRQINGV